VTSPADAAALTLYATAQEIPPDHRGGHTLGRDELIVEDVDYDQALGGRAPACSPRVADHRPAGRTRSGHHGLIAPAPPAHLGDQEARWTMSTSPAENPVSGVVTFTACGNAALDQVAETLAAGCDGSPTSIADILERVLKADIEDLAASLSETAQPAGCADLVDLDVEEVGPPAESPDEAARRRLLPRSPRAAGNPGTPGAGIAR